MRNRTIAVVWRGTDNIGGWIKDFTFVQTQFPPAPAGVECHEGFLTLATNLQPDVERLVAKAQGWCRSCPLLFTGHSLGASLATLSALLYNSKSGGNPSAQILNFGSPRIFNVAGATWLSGGVLDSLNITSHVRVTSMHDPVPHLPPQNSIVYHYRHSPNEVWETSNDPLKFKQCVGGEDPSCADSMSPIDFDVVDHARYMGLNLLDGVPHGCLFFDGL